MKKIIMYALASMLILPLTGCERIQEKLHLLPNQDEQECLNSERLNFKDPDVIFVANLGDRGWKLSPNTYWVRYKAKNSYGAYLQGNMLCKKSGEKWVRDLNNEFLIKMDVTADLMKIQNERMRAGKDVSPRYKNRTREFADIAFEHANEILDESPDSLAQYVKPSSNTGEKPVVH